MKTEKKLKVDFVDVEIPAGEAEEKLDDRTSFPHSTKFNDL